MLPGIRVFRKFANFRELCLRWDIPEIGAKLRKKAIVGGVWADVCRLIK